MASIEQPDEGEVAAGLEFAGLLAIVDSEILGGRLLVICVTRPLQLICPGSVAEPAGIVSVAVVNRYDGKSA